MRPGDIERRKEPDDAIPLNSVGDIINVGDWYWVTSEEDEWDEEKEEDVTIECEDLMCVVHVGSNYVKFEAHRGRHGIEIKIHFKDFHKLCRFEPNWKDIIKGKVKEIQGDLRAKIQEITNKAESLSLIKTSKALPEPDAPESLLPTVATTKPDKYKHDLIKAKDEEFPTLTREVKELNEDLTAQTRNLYLPDMAKMGKVKKGIEKIEDQIFTVELYVGMKEDVAHIKKGKPAPEDEPISIRQMLLYMDEECLIDYQSGGMDFKTLKQFDKWIIKKKNLERILPEERGVVAMQVRRHDKDYGRAENPLASLIHFNWNQENMHSYLLIRNGKNVYRLATDIDFSPRVVPLKGDLMSEKAFIKKDKWHDGTPDEHITPDHIEYDKFLAKEIGRMKKYNRIILVLQGLIDRTNIFQPMPRVNLTDPEMVMKWCKLIRDEENVIDSPPLPWDEYRDALNASLKKGKVVYGVGRTSHYREGYYRKPSNESTPPDFSYVENVKKDRSCVRISWPWGMTISRDHGRWSGGYEESKMSTMRRHAWVPMNEVFNVTDYNEGDYRMFLLNRHTRSEYLQWARCLFAAEDFKKGNMKEYKGPDKNDFYQGYVY